LYYYQYYPMCKAFFEALGAETVVSPPTNKDILSCGSSRAVAETCLPVKVFFGHVRFLADRCDCMFIPAIRSLGRKAYHCSKFLGLPDMTKALIPECPPILDPEIDLNRGRRRLCQIVHTLGRHFTSDKGKVKRAAEEALKANLAYNNSMSREGITPIEALEGSHQGGAETERHGNTPLKLEIGIVGHPYVIYDDYINHRLISRLQALGGRILTPEMMGDEALHSAMTRLVGREHWSFEADILGAAECYLEARLDGIISVAVFGCGPDSMMINMAQRRARQFNTPFMNLSLDEHTSEGGLVTRLEAFLDMVERRKRICA
jgi:predicted nucleotide-binding protein (sugar kinase/HSP70/actin superfamily)